MQIIICDTKGGAHKRMLNSFWQSRKDILTMVIMYKYIQSFATVLFLSRRQIISFSINTRFKIILDRFLKECHWICMRSACANIFFSFVLLPFKTYSISCLTKKWKHPQKMWNLLNICINACNDDRWWMIRLDSSQMVCVFVFYAKFLPI